LQVIRLIGASPGAGNDAVRLQRLASCSQVMRTLYTESGVQGTVLYALLLSERVAAGENRRRCFGCVDLGDPQRYV
jgi:hypothetical protein